MPRPDSTRQIPRNAYEKLAAELRTAIGRSEFASGTLLPTSTELAAQHNVSAGTINHAITLIK